MPPELRAAVFTLPVDEKLKLVEDLWDSIQEDETAAADRSAAVARSSERRREETARRTRSRP